MSPEQQRIKIAEACGWKGIYICMESGTFFNSPVGLRPNLSKEWILPDYLNDLNAMHEAEKVLMNHQRDEYVNALQQISFKSGNGPHDWQFIHSTAAPHAEAFLRALSLWNESQSGGAIHDAAQDQPKNQ